MATDQTLHVAADTAAQQLSTEHPEWGGIEYQEPSDTDHGREILYYFAGGQLLTVLTTDLTAHVRHELTPFDPPMPITASNLSE